MRLNTLLFAALCGLGLSCSSTTDEGETDLRLLEYSLAGVDGEAVPGALSSLPGLWIWKGGDGTVLTVAKGRLVCNADGTAEERYLFRLAEPGSAIWDPIWVNLDLTCEFSGPETVVFRYPFSGEHLVGTLGEGSDDCPFLFKKLPSPKSLRIGYAPKNSGAEFPAELAFSHSLLGNFEEKACGEDWWW